MIFSILDIAVKSSALLLMAAAVAGLMRKRSSAASRHLVWSLAVAGVVVLPLASVVLPSVPIPIARSVTAVVSAQPPVVQSFAPAAVHESPSAVRAHHSAPAAPVSWGALLPLVYGAGVLFFIARLAFEHWRTRTALSRTRPVDEGEWVTLLTQCAERLAIARPVRLARSLEASMPMTCGVRRAVIVIPSIADMWDEERRRAVILHELAHVARFDCLTQTLAAVASALYWPHPGIWWAARQLRVERELACDDCVLSTGTEPREYAGHLLEIAHSLGGSEAPALAVTMARPRQLEGRMVAMLDASRNRTPPAVARRVLAGVLAAAVVAPLAAATLVPAGALPTPQSSSPLRAVAAAVAQATSANALDAGTWQTRLSEDGRSVYLSISIRPGSSHGTMIPLDRVEGLAAILKGPAGPARYVLKRDAGTFEFEGVVRSGAGGGTFTFTPNAAFADELVRRGFSKPGALESGILAWSDIGFAYLDDLKAMKYERPTLEQLVNAGQHGVSLTYLRDMSGLGYRVGTLGSLVALRDHGVDPAFVRGMQTEGFGSLPADDLVRSRDHGIDPKYIRDMRALGYALNLNQLVDARNHGVDGGFVRSLRQLGYQLTLVELIAARDHGVDAGFVSEMAAAGYLRLSLADLINLRNHGVDAKTVQRLKDRGFDHPSIERLIDLQNRGASADGGLSGPRLQATGSWKAGVVQVLRDVSASFQRWADHVRRNFLT